MFIWIGHCPGSLSAGQAFPAGAGEAQAAGFRAAAGTAIHIGSETFGNDHARQIVHLVTGVTDEVDMGFGVGIEPLHTVYGADADDQPLLLEEGQIPVNRTQRDVRVFSFQLGVNPFGGGVCGCGAKAIENRFALFEVFRS